MPANTNLSNNGGGGGYGSILSNNNSPVHEEGKYKSSYESSRSQSSTTAAQQGQRLDVTQQQPLSPRKQLLSYHHRQRNDNDNVPSDVYYYYRESRQRWRMMILGLVGGLLGGVFLMKGFSSSSNRTVFSATGSSQADLPSEFDYIVVGGGPSGIVAATQLAQKLPTANIVLLESGTASQSSVLSNLQQRQHDHHNKQHIADVDSTEKIHYSDSLNKYDIPLMWSGIASTQRRVQDTFGLQPDPKSSAYWPIPLALLARGLGGCGLHNAMIYVRSLPYCFERWNLPNWTFDHMLPVYKRLETFVPRHAASDSNSTTTAKTTPMTEEETKKWLLQYRGQDGPIRTIHAGAGSDAMGDYFVRAAMASGLPLAGGAVSGSIQAAGGSGKSGGFNHKHADDRIGVGYYEFNVKNGVRHSVANAMLGSGSIRNSIAGERVEGAPPGGDSVGIPPNLVIQTGRTVTQVLWSKPGTRMEKPKAIGVSYIDNERSKPGKVWLRPNRAKGRQSEVILATGAIMTPQILWNSGIGEGGSLVDLPGVGKNLQDHPVLGMAYEITTAMTQDAPQMYAVADETEDYVLAVQVLNDLEEEKDFAKTKRGNELLQQKRDWALKQLGTFGTSGFSSGGFLRSPWASEEGNNRSSPSSPPPPDIQLTVFPRVIEPHQPKSKSKADVDFMRSRVMLVTVALLQPEARYAVRPSSYMENSGRGGDSSANEDQKGDEANHRRAKEAPSNTARPNDDSSASSFAKAMGYPLPSIELPRGKTEYLTDRDVKRLAWGVEQVRRILRFPPMSNITTTELYPGSSVVEGRTLDGYVRANHLANSHWVGTTKMGRDDDPMAVLDESLRVRGVHGLRVVDSGAMPFVPNGNTHSTVCAVASRGVDLIVADRE